MEREFKYQTTLYIPIDTDVLRYTGATLDVCASVKSVGTLEKNEMFKEGILGISASDTRYLGEEY